jgi:hypothetical protein
MDKSPVLFNDREIEYVNSLLTFKWEMISNINSTKANLFNDENSKDTNKLASELFTELFDDLMADFYEDKCTEGENTRYLKKELPNLLLVIKFLIKKLKIKTEKPIVLFAQEISNSHISKKTIDILLSNGFNLLTKGDFKGNSHLTFIDSLLEYQNDDVLKYIFDNFVSVSFLNTKGASSNKLINYITGHGYSDFGKATKMFKYFKLAGVKLSKEELLEYFTDVEEVNKIYNKYLNA